MALHKHIQFHNLGRRAEITYTYIDVSNILILHSQYKYIICALLWMKCFFLMWMQLLLSGCQTKGRFTKIPCILQMQSGTIDQ